MGDASGDGATAAEIALKEFELTWVVYDPQDPFGPLLALVTLSPVFIMVMFMTLVLFQRDLDSIAMLVGNLLNEGLNQILKRSIQQSRPSGARLSGSGMPSAHAQFISFFAAYVIAYTLKRLNSHRKFEQLLTIAGASVLAVAVCFSRVRLGYHTVEQVGVGALVGTLAGLSWHVLITKLAPSLFPLVAQSTFGRLLFLRDITPIPDLIVYQYQLCEQRLDERNNNIKHE